MKNHLLAGGVAFVASLAMAGAAFAQAASVNQAIPYQFRSSDPNQTAVLQNGVVLMQEMRNHTLGVTTGTSIAGNGTGLLGASTSGTNNLNEVVNETVNNCSASGAGADLQCGGGSIRSSTSQTSSNSPVTSSTTANGNTVREANSNNQSN